MLFGCRVRVGTMTAPFVRELSFLCMCPHEALKSDAGCTKPITHGTREIDGGRCRKLLRLDCFSSLFFFPRQWRRAHFQSRWIRLALSTKLIHCILSWAVDSHLSMSILQTDGERFRVSSTRFLCPPMERDLHSLGRAHLPYEERDLSISAEHWWDTLRCW